MWRYRVYVLQSGPGHLVFAKDNSSVPNIMSHNR